MSSLRAHLFGGFSITGNDSPLSLPRGTAACSLLAYLLTYRDRPHTRDLLAGTFWSDLPDATARRRLSQVLWQIRQALNPHQILLTEGDTVQFNHGLLLWLDIEEFARHRAQGTSGQPEAIEHCAWCIELYKGEFLAGLYDDWVLLERERLRDIFLAILGQLVEGLKARGEYERALLYAHRLASEDPWREEAHREIMRLCHLLGRDAEALKQFETCRRVLVEELGVEPSPETEALAAQIAARSGLADLPVLPSAARAVSIPLLERPDRLPLVGRQTELGELLRQAESTSDHHGGLTLVYGEAGVGKTRLLQELARNAEWRGIRVGWGRCHELAAPPAYQPLVEALRTDLPVLRQSGLEPLWRTELARLLPELATDGGAAPPLPPAEEQRRLLEALARAFLALADAAPHLLLLEDGQWMDPASLDAVRYLLPRLAEARLLVVMSLRTEELAGQQAAALTVLENTRLSRRLNLARLDLDETGELVRQALDLREAVPRFSARLYAETEGNPFFLIETLRGLMDEGLLRRDAGGAWSTPWDEATPDYAELPLPAGVAQTIRRRLDRLPPLLAEALNLAAVIGRGVAFDLWQQVTGQPERDLLAAGDELCAQGLLLPAETAGADYTFAHDQIRRVTYKRLAAPRRRAYHRRVAEALARLAPGEPEALAYHWTRARVWDQAADCHQQAGDRARAVYANAEAVAHYSQAIEALARLPGPADLARLFDLRLAREAVHALQGERAAQAEELAALEALAERLDDNQCRVQVALRQVYYAQVSGNHEAAMSAAHDVIDLAQALQDVPSEALGYLYWGRSLWFQGDCEAARPKLERSLALARAARLRQLEADTLRMLGNLCGYLNDYAEALAYYEQSLAVSQEIGDRQGEAGTLNNIGAILNDQGNYKQGVGYLQQALAAQRAIGYRRVEGNTLSNLGAVLVEQGEYALGTAYLEQALDLYHELGDPQGEGWLLNSMGEFAIRFGDYARGETLCQRALRLCREVGDRLGETAGLGHLALLAHHRGDHQAACDYCAQALAISQELGERYYRAYALKTLGHALADLGRLAEAADAFQEALHLRRELGQPNLALGSLAGLACVCLAQGNLVEARAYVEEVLGYLDGHSLSGVSEPFYIYLTCYRVLGQDPRAEEVLYTAHRLLQERAAILGDEALRQAFLENVAAHREIVAAYHERQPKQQVVRLPRAGAPTGRPLREDEYVSITWTLATPDDASIANEVDRRRHRLLRLLHQAAAQGAAPTVDDLAAALDVSWMTLKRDLAALRRAGHGVRTRGSKP
jgi:DNA-binding SARP family transcriptional activator/Tfp pilus assembly protein PilF